MILNQRTLSEHLSSSGQPEPDQFAQISTAGFDVIINLAMPDSGNAVSDEGAIVTGLGMTYVHLPVPFDAPSTEQLEIFFGLMDGFSGKNIWVHCAKNYRVSAFLYLYHRLRLGESEVEARRVILPDWEPNETWRSFMQSATAGSGL